MATEREASNYFSKDKMKNACVFDDSFLTHGPQMTPEKTKQLLGKNKVAMIALNYPVGEKLWPLWQAADLRITDVGGAGHLCEASKKLAEPCNPQEIAPHLIIGNIDRLNESACGWKQHGSKLLKIVDEHKSDLQRCLEYLLSKPGSGQQASDVDIVLVYGAFNPRVDKILGNLSILNSFYKKFKRIILVDEHNIVEVLSPGIHTIKMEGLSKDKTMACGLFPVAGQSNEVATQGLKWDLKGERLEMGSLVSRSNEIENSSISISASDPVLFTIGCGHCHPEKQHMHA